MVRDVAADAGFSESRIFDICVVSSEAAANAIEHSPVRGQVEVKTLLYPDRLEVQVSGPGKFQAPARLKERAPRGLGLPLMATLSDHLALYSDPRGGTLVSLTFYLPGVRRDLTEEEPLPPSVHELLESHEHLRTILETSPTGVVILDADGRASYVNRRARELYGFPTAGLALDERLQKVRPFLPDGRPYPRERLPVLRALRDGEEVHHVEMILQRPDGLRLPVMASSSPLMGDEGVVTGVVTVFEDISERKMAEDALRESEERHRIVADFTSYWEYWVSPARHMLYMSPAVELLTGYTREEFLANPWLIVRIVHREDRARMKAHLRLLEGPPERMEFRIVRKDGQERWIEHTCQEVRGADGQFLGRRASNRDITERHRAERVLCRQAELLERLFELLPVMLIMFDPHLHRFTLNRHAEEVLGWTTADANEADFLSKAYPDPEYRAQAEAYMQSLEPGWREWMVTAKDGRLVPSEWANIHLADDRYIGIGVDLTQKVRAAQEEERLQAELELERGLLRAVVEEAPVAFALWRADDLRLELFNPAYQALAPERSMEGRCLGDIWPELPQLVDEFRRVADTGEPYEAVDRPVEIRRSPDGPVEPRRFTYSVLRIPLPDTKGWGLLNMAVETTDRVLVQQHEHLLRLGETERARLAAASNRINDVISCSMRVEDVLQQALEEVGRALRVDGTFICMREGDSWVVRHQWGFDHDLQGQPLAYAKGTLSFSVQQDREPLVIDEVQADSGALAAALRPLGVRSVMAAPLVLKTQVIGMLFACQREQAVRFDLPQVDFIRRTANSMSLALETAGAFASLREELARTRLLSEVAAVLAGALEVKPLARSLLAAIAAHLDLHLGSFYVLDPDGRTLDHLAFLGYPPEAQDIFARVPLDESTNLGYTLSRGLPYLTHESAPYGGGLKHHVRLPEVDQDRWIILPLRVSGQVLGGMVLTFNGRRPFRRDEMTLFQTIGSLVTIAFRNARLYEEQKCIAETMQSALLDIPASIGRVRLGHLYRSATEAALVGGDFYDVFAVKHGYIAMMIGDVAGHGIQAARTATLVKDVVHAFTHQTLRPHEVLKRTNWLLVEKDLPGFVTLFLGILDGESGRLRFASAGHPETLLRRATGEVERLGMGAAPLGIYPDASWKHGEVMLGEGDLLLLYTDGVLEARRDSDFFGEERLERLVRRKRVSPERLPQTILDQVLAFSDGRLTDDVALLALTLKS